MSEDFPTPLFGSLVNLPSIAGIKSGVEPELLHLLNEIDIAFTSEQTKLHNELSKAKSICRAQKEEINKLRQVLQISGNIPKEIKHYFSTYKTNAELEQLRSHIQKLTVENEKLKHQVTEDDQPIMSSENDNAMSASIMALQDEVCVLRDNLKKSKLEKLFFKEQCDKLAKLCSKLQDIIDEETQKVAFIAKYPQLYEHTEDIIFSAFKKATAKDEVDLRTIGNDLHHKIVSCFEELVGDYKCK